MRVRGGGRARRASGVTLSTYITICIYKPLRKHDPLAENAADLSKILIKQKKKTPTQLLDAADGGCLGLVTWEALQCPGQAVAGGGSSPA